MFPALARASQAVRRGRPRGRSRSGRRPWSLYAQATMPLLRRAEENFPLASGLDQDRRRRLSVHRAAGSPSFARALDPSTPAHEEGVAPPSRHLTRGAAERRPPCPSNHPPRSGTRTSRPVSIPQARVARALTAVRAPTRYGMTGKIVGVHGSRLLDPSSAAGELGRSPEMVLSAPEFSESLHRGGFVGGISEGRSSG